MENIIDVELHIYDDCKFNMFSTCLAIIDRKIKKFEVKRIDEADILQNGFNVDPFNNYLVITNFDDSIEIFRHSFTDLFKV